MCFPISSFSIPGHEGHSATLSFDICRRSLAPLQSAKATTGAACEPELHSIASSFFPLAILDICCAVLLEIVVAHSY